MLCGIGAPNVKKSKAQPLLGLGLKLAWEEHDQGGDNLQHLLITQLKLDCQLEHGKSPVCAGSAANWLGLAIYYTPLHGVALGLPRMALSSSLANPLGGMQFVTANYVSESNDYYAHARRGRTLSRVVARQLGLLTQVRYPARGSARVIPLTYNVELTGPRPQAEGSSDQGERG